MKIFKIDENFEDSENEQFNFLYNTLSDKDLRKDVVLHLHSRGMDLRDIEVIDDESFTLEYESNSMDGSIPSRISYYIDDLSEILGESVGTDLSWSFGRNGNCNFITFYLNNKLDPKILKVKKSLKFHGI